MEAFRVLVIPCVGATGSRPVVVFVCSDEKAMLELARVADQTMKARLGVKGSPAALWFYPAREHVFFVLESDLYHDRLDAYALPSRPPALRADLYGSDKLQVARVSLLPEELRTRTQARKPKRSTPAVTDAELVGDVEALTHVDDDTSPEPEPIAEPTSAEPVDDANDADETVVVPKAFTDLDEAIERQADEEFYTE